MITKATIKHNFSRHATRYDRYCRVQEWTATELLRDAPAGTFARILDIGCGTGNLTQRLRQAYPSARIEAIDLCPNMVALARRKSAGPNIAFRVADAEVGDLGGPHDLIASNATFQWFNNFERTIVHCLSHLATPGVLLFSMFGPETYHELAATLGAVLGEDVTVSSAAFVDVDRVTAGLRARVGRILVREERITQSYPSLMALLKTIKYSGTRGQGLPARALNREQILALEHHYRTHHGAIVATHQVFYCWARKGSP